MADTKISALPDGSTVQATDQVPINRAGTNMRVVVTKAALGLGNVDNTSNATERAATATLSGKTLTAPIIDQGIFSEGASPSTPAANKVALYAKADGLLYSKDDAGVETLVSGGSGGGGGGGDALTSNPLSQFASTTSAQLAAVLSDEVGGTGGFVRAAVTTDIIPIANLASGTPNGSKFVRDDGTLAVPAGGSASNSFATISVSGQSDVVADSSTDTLTLVAGSNVTITTNAGSDTITIASTGGGGGTDLNLAASWTTGNTRLTTVGDSLSSVGYQGAGTLPSTTWQYMLLNLPALSGKVTTSNLYVNATGGAYVATRLADYDTYVKPNRPAADGGTSGVIYSPLIIWLGTNDAWASAPATFETDLNSYITTAKADGFGPIILLTGKDSDLLTSDTMRANLQSIIERTNKNQLADYIFPAHLLFPDNSDTSLISDGTHPGDTGNALLANRLNAWFLAGAPFIAPANLAAARGIDSSTADRALISNANLVGKTRQYETAQGKVISELTDGSAVAWDGINIPHATLLLTGTGHSLNSISSIVVGAEYILEVSRTGTQTLDFAAAYIWLNDTTPTQSTDSNVVDVFRFRAAGYDAAYIIGEHLGTYEIPFPVEETTLVEDDFSSSTYAYEGYATVGVAPNITNTPSNVYVSIAGEFGLQRSATAGTVQTSGGGVTTGYDAETTDCNVQCLVRASGNGGGVSARVESQYKCYKFILNPNDGKWYLYLFKDDDSNSLSEITTLGSGDFTHNYTTGDTLRLECNGTNLVGKINGTEVVNVTDSTYTTQTLVGFGSISGGGIVADDFKITTF